MEPDIIQNNEQVRVRNYGSITIEFSHTNKGESTARTRKRFAFLPSWYTRELWEVFNIAWTMVVLSLFQSLMKPISLMFIRPYGTVHLGGIGLGNTVVGVSGLKIGGGLATACDTLFSQAYGSKNKKKVGVYLQRSVFIILLCTLPCCAIQLNTDTLMILMGQQPKIASHSARFVLLFMPAVPAFFLFSILKKYLRNLNIVRPLLLVAFTGLAVNALSHYILVSLLKLGIDGCAISQVLGAWTQSGTAITYILTSGMYKETWPGWSRELFQEWGMFAKLALGSLFMVCLQFWAFEIGTILSGTLDATELAAQTIIFQLDGFAYMVPLGVGIACNIRVGHLLGANKPKEAKRAVFAGYTIIWGTALVTASLLVGLRYYLPLIFSNDRKVIEVAASLLPVLALFHVFDSTAGVCMGILRGCGRQTIGAVIIFLGMYVIGLPAGVSMMLLTYLKSAGFWWGMAAAMFCEGTVLCIIVYRTDWASEAKMAQIRAGVFRSDGHDVGEDNEDSGIDNVDDSPGVIDYTAGLLDDDVHPDTRGYSNAEKHDGSGDKVAYQVPIKLSVSQLIVRRGSFIFIMLSTLGLGIFTHFYFPPVSVQTWCLHNNRTSINASFPCGLIWRWVNSTSWP